MKSIKRRLVAYFMFVIIITVVILELLLINAIQQNYYKNLEDSITNQLKISSNLYLKYFSDASLKDNVLNNVDTFWKQSSAQVEILDLSGKVIMDSIGVSPQEVIQMEDYKEALKGKKGKWVGRVSYDSEKVMAVSFPLMSGKNIVGALRFITSLRDMNRYIMSISSAFILIGIIVIFISGFVSILLANTIVGPLKEVTNAALKMAAGDFKARSKRKYKDEIGKLSDTLNYMAEEILEKDRLKNDFISSVSHELRTPLTSIKGWAVTLEVGDLEDKLLLSEGLKIIEKESDRLTILVEELLDFSSFVSNKVSLKKDKVDIKKVMEYLRAQMAPRAAREDITFNVSLEAGVDFLINDENRLIQVFINILDNAFKFTPAGGKVDFYSKIEGDKIIFCLEDTGIGIPIEDLPRVKEKFFKGKNSKSKNGIGLSICDEIIRLMDGTFDIKSSVNIGTQIYITLPLGNIK